MMKRMFALLIALMMVLSCMSGLAIPASAAEDDVYVLNYNGAYAGHKWQYFSPYWPAFELDGVSDYTQSIAFTLYDTKNASCFPTYCTDLEVGLDNNSDFRRINLEDSTYAGAAAGKLRSVFLKGYPNTGVEDLAAAAGVAGLTVGEAVAATQAAIWQTAHGDRVAFTDFVRTIDTDWSPEVTEHFDECYAEIENGYAAEENKETIQANIRKVFNYLINLEATEPTGAIASRKSFKSWKSEVVSSEDGTCDLVVTANVDVTMNATDTLTLAVVAGDYTASVALENGEKEYTLTIEDVPAAINNETITLTIEGVQSLRDVYLFDAVGDRGASQSLIGCTGNALPVYAAVTANDRELIINKTDDGVGLQNIIFDVYYVCSVEEYLTNAVTIGTGVIEVDGVEYFSAPTEADIAKYTSGFPFVTLTTDANGIASHNFGTDNDGIYIVVERKNAVTTGAVAPFFVAIPGGSDPLAAETCRVEVKPKNNVIDEDIIIEKDVNEIGNNHDTHDVNELHTWIIQASIPTGLATGLKYEITDTLNYQLTFRDNVVVTVSEKAAKAHEDIIELVEGEDYILTVTPGTVDVNGTAEEITSFSVALTGTGMEKVASVEGTEPEVRVYFDAVIDEDAILGTEIPNQAHIRYENNVGIDFEKDSDQPEVHTGGLKLIKTDAASGKLLAGAAFTLNVRNEDGTYTPVKFYSDAAMTTQTSEVTTDGSGEAIFYGVAYGTYYLIETSAPGGYNLLTNPVEVTINASSHLDANNVKVVNSAKFQLPDTGGIGTLIFTLCGSSLFAAAGALLFGTRKKYR